MALKIDELKKEWPEEEIDGTYYLTKPLKGPLLWRLKDAWGVLTGRYEAFSFVGEEKRRKAGWVMKVLLITILLTAAGCSSMKVKVHRLNIADPNMSEYYEASHETFLVDWERLGFTGMIEGLGSVGSIRTQVDSEGGEIVEDVSEVVNPVKAVMP
jgi:hypothetical protein